ncbi:carbonic anhydrase 2 [Musca domestica]|uniref:carbonic anhydrase n=1 Tax=Musca domestica TaxID=7370 RepID=A0ABM3VPJ0_MUSDO|nr:carbonic anhydrase 2 [Musca domestica]
MNNGHQLLIKMMYRDTHNVPTLVGGMLEDKGTYRFKEIYFSWLFETPEEWSFNEVNFPAELHIVFYHTKYGDLENALNADEGIAVLCIGFRVRRHNTPSAFLRIVDTSLSRVLQATSNTTVPKNGSVSFSDFLPKDLKYFYGYTGTMLATDTPWPTTCKAKVIWIDVEESLQIHPDQVLELRKLRNFHGKSHFPHAIEYSRPTIPVYRSLDPNGKDIEYDNGQQPTANVWCLIVIFFLYLAV